MTMDRHAEFSSTDGTLLFHRWIEATNPRAVVVLVHGITEHSGRYLELLETLAGVSVTAYAYDQRGHGRSGGIRGDVAQFGNFVTDLGAFCDHVGGEAPDLPFFVFGHSMGGLVAARYASRRPVRLDGVVLSSVPAKIGSATPTLLARIIRILSHVVPRWPVDPRLDPERLTHDLDVLEALRNDPLVLRQITMRLAREVMKASECLEAHVRRIQVPVLALHGREDSIADPRGLDRLLGWLDGQHPRHVVLDGLRHEIFNESRAGRDQAFEHLVGWIRDQVRS